MNLVLGCRLSVPIWICADVCEGLGPLWQGGASCGSSSCSAKSSKGHGRKKCGCLVQQPILSFAKRVCSGRGHEMSCHILTISMSLCVVQSNAILMRLWVAVILGWQLPVFSSVTCASDSSANQPLCWNIVGWTWMSWGIQLCKG